MSDTTSPSDSNDRCTRGRRRRLGFLGVAALIGAGLFAATAMASGPGAGFGPPWAHGPCAGDVTVEGVEKRMNKFADFVLDDIDATDAQRAEIEALISATAPEVVTHRTEGLALRDAFVEQLSAETVDAEALGELRAEAMVLVERGSNGHLDTLLAVSEILDAEQRQQLVENWQDWHR